MPQKKMIGIVLLVVGIIGLYFGFNAANAPAGEITEALTGGYSDRTMLYLVVGAAAAVVGAVMTFRRG